MQTENTTTVATEAKTAKTNELLSLITSSGIKDEKQIVIAGALGSFYSKAIEWNEKIEELVITSPEEVDKMKTARETRLLLKNMRLEALGVVKQNREEVKKLMADFVQEDNLWLKGGQLIEATFKNLEGKLEEKEKFAENWDKERREKLNKERLEILVPLGFVYTEGFGLGDMDEAMFNSMKLGLETMAKQKEERQREEDKLKAEKELEQEKERERIKKENEKLRQRNDLQAERFQKILPYQSIILENTDNCMSKFTHNGDVTAGSVLLSNLWNMPEPEFDEMFQTVKVLFDKKEDELKAEQERIKKEKALKDNIFNARKKTILKMGFTEFNGIFSIKDETGNPIIQQLFAKTLYDFSDIEFSNYVESVVAAIAQRKEALKTAAELKKRQDEEKAKKEQEKKAAKAPDKVKLMQLAEKLVGIVDGDDKDLKLPDVKSEEAKDIIKGVNQLLLKIAMYIKEKTENI